MSDLSDPENQEDADEPRLGCLARIIPVTTPGCATFLMVVFLLTTVVTVWIVFRLDRNSIPWRHSFSWWRLFAILALVVAIPIVVHKTIRLWLEGLPISFPELDYAWRAGIQSLAKNELSVSSVPVFLITGSSGEAQEKAIMNATGMRFSVEGVPQGPAPIHWYANSEAIYLFCSDSSWNSALASLREELAVEYASSAISAESPAFAPTGFDIPESFSNPSPTREPVPTIPAPQNPNMRGTLELDNFVNANVEPAKPQPTIASSSSKPGQSPFRGTLILGNESQTAELISQVESAPTQRALQQTYNPSSREALRGPASFSAESNPLSNKKPVLVSHQYSTTCLQELQYLGQLLRRERQPLCPINGVLALIQFESIHASQAEVDELKKAIRVDLDTIRSAFQLRVPVSALIVGLEKERGFRELVYRVGKERALSQRFGRRFDVQAIPTTDQLVSLATHLCGVFEDWSYTLFREEQALTRPGNIRLYELLSKVRCTWKARLGELLAGGFGFDATTNGQESSNLFSGCYFAATGDSPDRQAFVKGVIEKLGEEQELIEWTSEALRANQRQNFSAKLGMIVTLILAVSLVAMYFVFNFR